jgi:RNA recognition motif-containing protein
MNKIYVGNLSFDLTDASLQEAFQSFGNIVEVAIIKDRYSGKSKGFGFITFSSASEAESALTMNGKELAGRALNVSIAREEKRRTGGSGGHRGGHGGGRHRDDRGSRW